MVKIIVLVAYLMLPQICGNNFCKCIDDTHMICDMSCQCDGLGCDYNRVVDSLIQDETWYIVQESQRGLDTFIFTYLPEVAHQLKSTHMLFKKQTVPGDYTGYWFKSHKK